MDIILTRKDIHPQFEMDDAQDVNIWDFPHITTDLKNHANNIVFVDEKNRKCISLKKGKLNFDFMTYILGKW